MSTARESIQFQRGSKLLTSHSLLWFGAAVSIAEIYTGAMLAPLGFLKALLAIVLGHGVGFGLLLATGLIGARTRQSAMAATAPVFGSIGSKFFALMNVLQLIGWTAVMIIGGSKSLQGLGFGNLPLGSFIIGALILIWILMGLQHLGMLNNLAVILLFVLTLVLSFVVFRSPLPSSIPGTMSFGLAFELSIAMPLSWLPLISDYTKQGNQSTALSLLSAGAYSLGSTWMYVIGLGAALYMGSADITSVLGAAGLGSAAMLIVILSTVTTTFLDAHSAGESAAVLIKGLSVKLMAVIVTIIGTLIAIFTPIENYQGFLYWIGSVFAPMIAIQLVNHYGRIQASRITISINCALWLMGFALYRQFIALETLIGATLPVMLVIGAMTLISHKIHLQLRKDDQHA